MSGKYPTLRNAPIKEAIIQVYVFPPRKGGKSTDKFNAYINDNYPHRNEGYNVEFGFSVEEDGVGTHHRQIAQNRYFSEDKKKVVQYTNQFLVLSQLEPYPCWDDFIADYMELWERFALNAGVEKIGAVLRFINQFRLPSDSLHEKLHIGGGIAVNDKGKEMDTHQIFTKFLLSRKDILANVIAQLSSERDGEVDVVFDIETRLKDAVEYADNNTVKQALEELREFKNEIFFSNVDDAEERFG